MDQIPRIAHISDTHGNFPQMEDHVKVVIHTGDLLPDMPYQPIEFGYERPSPLESSKFQELWVRKKAEKFMGWLKDRTFIFCAGNHDWFDPVPLLQRMGIDAYNCTEKVVTTQNLTFYGWPYVSMDCHPWNYAVSTEFMSKSLDDVASWWDDMGGIDVLLTHAPPAGIFDLCHKQNLRFGNSPLNDFLSYKIRKAPKALLCGHIHGDTGITYEFDTLISQAACKINYLEIRK